MIKLLHAELSYQVRGVLFDVYNALGPMLRERFYRDAVIIGLQQEGIACEAEKRFEVFYAGEQIGAYFVDVWIESGKMLLELKVKPAIENVHRAQAISYLKVTDADLAIVANFGEGSLVDERLPNFLRHKQPTFSWQPQTIPDDFLYPNLTQIVQRSCHHVHFALGPGFLNKVYRRAMMVELAHNRIRFDYIQQLPIHYGDHLLGQQSVNLFLVDRKILLAAHAQRDPENVMAKHLKARLRHLGLQLGMLANFHDSKLALHYVRVPNS